MPLFPLPPKQEIEAIPMPPDLTGTAATPPLSHLSQDSPQLSPAPHSHTSTDDISDSHPLTETVLKSTTEQHEVGSSEDEDEEAVLGGRKKKAATTKKNMYSMFVKGDTEFTDHSNKDSNQNQSHSTHSNQKQEVNEEIDLPEGKKFTRIKNIQFCIAVFSCVVQQGLKV